MKYHTYTKIKIYYKQIAPKNGILLRILVERTQKLVYKDITFSGGRESSPVSCLTVIVVHLYIIPHLYSHCVMYAGTALQYISLTNTTGPHLSFYLSSLHPFNVYIYTLFLYIYFLC